MYWQTQRTKTRVIHVSTTAKLSGKIENIPIANTVLSSQGDKRPSMTSNPQGADVEAAGKVQQMEGQ
jgi:hypothetical protein